MGTPAKLAIVVVSVLGVYWFIIQPSSLFVWLAKGIITFDDFSEGYLLAINPARKAADYQAWSSRIYRKLVAAGEVRSIYG